MSQETSPTDAPLSLLEECTADLRARQNSGGTSIELIPDDWNRGAPDNPCHSTPVTIG
jgi:hypothetical protein